MCSSALVAGALASRPITEERGEDDDKVAIMSEYPLSSQEPNLMSPVVYDHDDVVDAVVREMGPEGDENIDPAFFCNEISDTYPEDQKNILTWNNSSHQYDGNFESYGDQQPIMYSSLQPPVPLSIQQIPANVDYAGDLDFDILITSHTANRNSWIYSSVLNKVFINMQNILPVDIKRNSANVDLFLRATLLYSLPQFAQELVERCSTHIDPRHVNNKDIDMRVAKHVLRCTNPGSAYMGDTDRKEHLSVVTPLGQPQAGMSTVRVNYQFMCKNSCPSGMNRRAVDVIFTLEDSRFNVLGRRKLSVRVCSCPKRDKEKEEKEHRDSLVNHQPTHGKKRKISSVIPRPKLEMNGRDDCNIYELKFRVVGVDIAKAVLKYSRDLHSGKVAHENYEEEKQTKLKDCAGDINAMLLKYTTSE